METPSLIKEIYRHFDGHGQTHLLQTLKSLLSLAVLQRGIKIYLKEMF